MNLKQQLVVKTPTDEFEIWSKKQYDEYIAGCVEYGAGSAYRIVTHFNEDENLLKDSPYQGSAGVWRKASERLPKVGIYNALYNGDHVIFQVHDGGFRVINYHGEKNDSPKLFLIRYLDDSAASPAGDGWVSEKPEFKSECTFLTATRIFRSDKWNYSVWSIAKIEGDDGWYLGIVDGTGDEWGDIEDLTADMYLILPTPPNKSV